MKTWFLTYLWPQGPPPPAPCKASQTSPLLGLKNIEQLSISFRYLMDRQCCPGGNQPDGNPWPEGFHPGWKPIRQKMETHRWVSTSFGKGLSWTTFQLLVSLNREASEPDHQSYPFWKGIDFRGTAKPSILGSEKPLVLRTKKPQIFHGLPCLTETREVAELCQYWPVRKTFGLGCDHRSYTVSKDLLKRSVALIFDEYLLKIEVVIGVNQKDYDLDFLFKSM